MDLDAQLPFKVCLNPPRMEERRQWVSEMFRMHRLQVLRWPSSDAPANRHARGYPNPGLRENYLTFMLAVRRALFLKKQAVLFLEDDVVFADDFRERVAALDLPDDWGLLYLGCQHVERPSLLAPGLLKVAQALDTHAVAVNGRYFKPVLHFLNPRKTRTWEDGPQRLDVALSELHKLIPTYAAWPNLAWQRMGYSFHNEYAYSNYDEEGRQKNMPEVVVDL